MEAVAGERDVFKRQAPDARSGRPLQRPKRLTIVADCSGSMYSFQGVDGRLRRELEMLVAMMEALDGQGTKVDYRIVGHSGETAEIPLVEFGAPPADALARLAVIEKVSSHSQFCWSGDNTLDGIRAAVAHTAAGDADEHVVIAVTDANFDRYRIRPFDVLAAAAADPRVSVRLVTLGSLFGEAERFARALPGVVFDVPRTDMLPVVLRTILMNTVLK